MTLLREAFRGQPISRRAAFQAAGTGMAGLATAALLGCEKEFSDQKPEELFQKLLTTPLRDDELPKGMISKGNSEGTLDATAQRFKAVGQANILIVDRTDQYAPDLPLGAISYTVFPDKSTAQRAFNTFTSQSPSDKKVLNKMGYDVVVTSVSNGFVNVNAGAAIIDHVMVAGFYANDESRAVTIVDSAVNHLRNINKPKETTTESSSGFRKHVSRNNPFEILYPNGLNVETKIIEGRKADFFSGSSHLGVPTTIGILSKPISKGLSLDDFARSYPNADIIEYHYINPTSLTILSAATTPEDIKKVIAVQNNLITYLNNLLEVKVAGKETRVVETTTPDQAEFRQFRVLFIDGNKGWEITLNASADLRYLGTPDVIPVFQKMLESFKLK